MGYRLLADVVMLVHFGFLAFVALGGFVAWRRPRAVVLHVSAVAWGLISVLAGVECPLTYWEERLRLLAGQNGLPGGFVATYLTGVIYPAEYLRTAQLVVAVLVAVSWVGLALRWRRTRSVRPAVTPVTPPPPASEGRTRSSGSC